CGTDARAAVEGCLADLPAHVPRDFVQEHDLHLLRDLEALFRRKLRPLAQIHSVHPLAYKAVSKKMHSKQAKTWRRIWNRALDGRGPDGDDGCASRRVSPWPTNSRKSSCRAIPALKCFRQTPVTSTPSTGTFAMTRPGTCC